jgi:hypothetical protein
VVLLEKLGEKEIEGKEVKWVILDVEDLKDPLD